MIQDTTLRSFELNIRPKLHNLRGEIRQLLRQHPEGLTNKEMAQLIGKDASTISGIVRPMVVARELYEVSERKCRVTGNTAKVWKLIPARETQTVEAPSQLSLV